MTREVITTTPDTPIEDAASLMVNNKVGGLPVVDGKAKVVGIITETDVFRTFVEMSAERQAGLRLTLQVPERRGVLAALSQAIADLGGSIDSVGSFYGEVPDERGLVVKVRDVSQGQLVDTLEALGDHVVDARERLVTESILRRLPCPRSPLHRGRIAAVKPKRMVNETTG